MTCGSILLATSNTHKLQELGEIFDEMRSGLPVADRSLRSAPVELVGLDALGVSIAEPVEDQSTFEGNALLKARYYADASGQRCLADDSGLEVDALGGDPGVMSARYAGVTGPARKDIDAANIQLLLRNLADMPAEQRVARFVCAMAVCDPNIAEPLAVVRGSVHGRILGPGDEGYQQDGPSGRGDNGFGYDPVFLVPELGLTAAEMTPQQKNAISHRGNAARLMWRKLVTAPGA